MDLASYEALIRQHRFRLHSAACRILRNDAEAEEAVQDAHLLALTHLDQFEGRSTFVNWLTKITINEALSRRRRLGASRAISLDDETTVRRPAATGRNPEQQFLDRECRSVVERALGTLPETYRLVFSLRELQDMSTAETAERLGLSDACVKSRLMRARALLQRKLSEAWKPPAGSGGTSARRSRTAKSPAPSES